MLEKLLLTAGLLTFDDCKPPRLSVSTFQSFELLFCSMHRSSKDFQDLDPVFFPELEALKSWIFFMGAAKGQGDLENPIFVSSWTSKSEGQPDLFLLAQMTQLRSCPISKLAKRTHPNTLSAIFHPISLSKQSYFSKPKKSHKFSNPLHTKLKQKSISNFFRFN